jgi:lambda family phage tail tape measure protein
MAQIAAAPGGLYAKGGTFLDGISNFSNSVVTSPTLFKFAHGVGLMGEEFGSPGEGVLPLRRNSRGQLGVIAANGNGGSNVVSLAPVYHIDARGADQAAVTRLKRALDQHVKDHAKIVAAADHRQQLRKTRPA